MRLTKKLLSFIQRVIRQDPDAFIALRLWYSSGSMTWSVQDATLTTVVADGPGQSLSVDLTQYTITSLVSYLASQPGYTVTYIDGTELSQLSAQVLLDASGDIGASNGNAIYGYTNPLYSYMEAMAGELAVAEGQIAQAIQQMSTKTGRDIWLDEIGSYYGVPRLPAELDVSYGPRIIAEVLRPRGNNVAIEAAIKVYTGQSASVTDVVLYGSPTPAYNGAINYDGTSHYNATSKPQYGLFDIDYGYDLINGGDITSFAAIVRDLIGRLRDAGTHLRALTLTGSAISDAYTTPPSDGSDTQSLVVIGILSDSAAAGDDSAFAAAVSMSALADAAVAGSEDLELLVTYNVHYDGVRYYDGSVPYSGGSAVPESI